jgi:hypothetical protein
MTTLPENRRPFLPTTVRRPFGEFATMALRRRVRETNAFDAHWVAAPNLAWVRWTREDGRFVYCAIRRQGDHITAELGTAPEPLALEELRPVTSLADASADRCRIPLGPLLHGHERWWSSGGSESSLVERIDWLAQQLQLRLRSFLAAQPVP